MTNDGKNAIFAIFFHVIAQPGKRQDLFPILIGLDKWEMRSLGCETWLGRHPSSVSAGALRSSNISGALPSKVVLDLLLHHESCSGEIPDQGTFHKRL
jgi:hypothetical protein